MKTLHLAAAATAVIAFAALPATAATLINGSFELGTDPGATFVDLTAGSSAITGWTVGGFGVDYIGGYWQASDGVRSIDLSGVGPGGVSQSFATVIGQAYTVTFDLSGNPDGGPSSKVALTTINGFLPQLTVYEVTAANSHANMNWETFTYTFTAFATSSTITFASFADAGPYGPALDNVSLVEGGGGSGSTIPEPATWALMVTGFGLVGIGARRRRQSTGRPVTA